MVEEGQEEEEAIWWWKKDRRRKKQFGGGRRTGGGREVCGELATALRGELGYKQGGFWQQGDLITINVTIDR